MAGISVIWPVLGARMAVLALIFTVFGLLSASSPAFSEDSGLNGDSVLGIQVENDLFGDGSDGHYTNGLRISYLFDSANTPTFARRLRDALPWLDDDGALRAELAWGQSIYTPSVISDPLLIPDDRPYAGWLYMELGLSVRHDDVRDTFLVNLGVVGPWALGKETQSRWHRLINVPLPQGWANQLHNEPALVLAFDRQWLGQQLIKGGDLEVDFSPRAGVMLGNVFTHASVGGVLRLGPYLPPDFGIPSLRQSAPGASAFTYTRGRTDWYLFLGFDARAVARNIFLDGNSFRDSHSVERKNFVYDLQGGAVMTLGSLNVPARLTYNFIFRRREFRGQEEPDIVGSVGLSFTY